MTLLSQQERRVWTRQPQIILPVSFDAIARGLKHLWVPSSASLLDRIGSAHLSSSGAGASIKASAQGLQYDTDATQTFGLAGAPITLAGKYLWVGIVNVHTNNITPIGPSGNAYNDGGYVLGRWNGTSDYYTSDGTGTVSQWTTNAYTLGTWATFAVQYTADTTYPKLWINGLRIGAGNTALSGQIAARRLAGITGFAPDCQIALSALWDGPQDDAYVAKILGNPWQLFEGRRTRRYISLGAGGATPKFRSRTISGTRAGSRGIG